MIGSTKRERSFIVAELSANHGAKLELALDTVAAAAKAGADAIKIQTYTPDTLTLPLTEGPFVVRTDNVWAGKSLHALYAEAMTPWEWTAPLKKKAEECGLTFFSTPFDRSAVDFLEQHAVPLYKVASFELVDLALVSYVARTGKPLILSTGMASWEEIEAAVRTCREAGNEQITLLRCVSSYPAKAEDMGLVSMQKLRTLGVAVGLSDHTRDNTAAMTAAALGASVIEKHFILDRTIGGPDAFFSLEPAEFEEMVACVRAVEAARGDERFGPSASEQKSLVFRRSLFVSADVNAGELLTCDNVRSVRPGNGLPPAELPRVLGRVATRAMKAGTPLEWSAIGPEQRASALPLRAASNEDRARIWEWAGVYSARAQLPDELFVAEGGALFVTQERGAIWQLHIAIEPERIGTGVLGPLVEAGCTLIQQRGGRVVRMPSEESLKPLGFHSFAQGWCERSVL